MIQDVSDQLFEKFTEAVRAELEQASAAEAGAKAGESAPAARPQAEALDAVALGTAVAGSMVRRWLANPGFWVAVAVLVLAVYWLSTR